MIPTRLELHNFLAYRAPEPIAFDGIELACLTGQNGVGKSSLLDAITWALWGKARAKREDDLIHLGQSEMQVSIDFEQEGVRYRVVRKRARSGRSSRGTVDLLVWGEDDQPRIINETGMRRTQDKINQILRLDYDTFVHSAFLQQGRADAFTLKTPAERKRILAEILGLELWSTFEDRTKQVITDTAQRIAILEHDIQRAEDEISREPQLLADMKALSADYDEAQAELDRVSARYDRVANSAAALRREKENLHRHARLMESRRNDVTAAQREIERLDGKIAEHENIIAQAESIEAGYEKLQLARAHQTVIAEQLAQKQELDERAHQLERQLAEQEATLARQRDVFLERIAGLQKQVASISSGELDAVNSQVVALERLDEQRDEKTRTLQAQKERRSALKGRLGVLRDEGTTLNQRLERLGRLAAADGAVCPLCGQALTAEHRDDTLATMGAERDAKREDYRSCVAEIQQIEIDSRAQQQEVEDLAAQLKHLPSLQQKKGALQKQLANARAAESALETETNQLRQIEAQLDDKAYGAELRRQLQQINAQREAISYDAASHADNRTQLETLSAYDRQQKQLEFAQLNLPEAQKQRAGAKAQMESLREAQLADTHNLEKIEADIDGLEAQVIQEGELRGEVDAKRLHLQGIRERKTITQQELNAVAAGRESQKRLRQRLDSARFEQGLLNELRVAFGRNGVPAMIIETAIPELEAEANDLLSRMSDGRMTIRFGTQRETVAGDLVETLDIEIADELGARDYELYSGGEAFRINFAIRIALSKMLARRAGAQLRTLFIDEGFGSQDADGRDKLVDAINKIQSDFDLILVITHIDELRESFPVHLLVEKTANGSIVTIQ